jgi:phenylpropionate dioxygenase-like ring-hydroxylating dioxygenase large terminal subunit
MACRQEEIPNPGDHTVYDILDQSIFLVRQDDMSIKAFHNVCPHRGMGLACGEGRFSLGSIVCPFHGWIWNLKGENTFILDQPDFKHGCLQNKDVNLKEVRVAQAFNVVFVNLDPEGDSFEDFMPADLRRAFEGVHLQDMYFHWHKRFALEANWKVAQEAFFEGYHVAQTHPQLIRRQIKPRPGLDLQKVASARRLNFAIEGYPQGHAYQGAINGQVRGLGRFPNEWLEGLSEEEQKQLVIDFHTNYVTELNRWCWRKTPRSPAPCATGRSPTARRST